MSEEVNSLETDSTKDISASRNAKNIFKKANLSLSKNLSDGRNIVSVALIV